ncbi:MAG TPA: tetratricopeptide repeat protein [Planctomycetota bacterium]|nr:tetratricopeptide repeat protein [Planctomycetota bacterium]
MVKSISGRFKKLNFERGEPLPLQPHECEQLERCLQNLQEYYNDAEPLLIRVLFHADKDKGLDSSRCAHLRLSLGRVYLFQGRPVEALAAFKRALDTARNARDEAAAEAIGRYRLMFEMMQ